MNSFNITHTSITILIDKQEDFMSTITEMGKQYPNLIMSSSSCYQDGTYSPKGKYTPNGKWRVTITLTSPKSSTEDSATFDGEVVN